MLDTDEITEATEKNNLLHEENKGNDDITAIFDFVNSELNRGIQEINLSAKIFPENFPLYDLFNICKDFKEITLNFSNSTFKGIIKTNKKLKNELIELPELNFTNVHFISDVHFITCSFNNSVFDGAVFYSISNFYGSYFNGCQFSKIIFKKLPVFTECCFSSGIDSKTISFNASEFQEGARFTNASFLGLVTFNNVKFLGSTHFSIIELQIFEPLSQQKGFDSISFKGSNFSNVDFTNREFTGLTDFSHCIFNKVPIFHGCKLHQYTTFPPQKNFKDTTSEEAVGAYRTLRIFMSDLKARNEESMFYSLEQSSLKNNRKFNFIDSTVSRFYKIFSNYGESVNRPLFFLFSTTLVAWIFYSLSLTPQLNFNAKIDFNILKETFWLAFYQIVKPFSVDAFLSAHQSIFFSGLFKLIASLQSLLSIIFVTLLLLAIRWKFKKD